MGVKDCSELLSFCRSSWQELVTVTRLELKRCNLADQDAEQCLADIIARRLKFLCARILDTPNDRLFFLFHKLIRNRVRDMASHRRLVPDPVRLTNRICYQFFHAYSAHQSTKRTPSLGVRLATWADDRLPTVKATFIYDRFACQQIELERAREHITC
jgi:hypothetical protein